MNTKPQAAVMDFGSSKITLMLAEQDIGEQVNVIACASSSYNGYQNGHWNDSDAEVNDAIAHCLEEVQSLSQKKIDRVYVGVPGSCIRVFTNMSKLEIKNRRITPADVEQLMDQASPEDIPAGYRILHRCPAWFKVDDVRTMEPMGQKGRVIECRCSFIVAEMNFMEDVARRLTNIGLTVVDNLSASLAVVLMIVSPEERDRGSIVIDSGFLYTEVMSVEGDALLYHDIVPMGGGHMTADLAMGLNIPMSLAEKVKRSYVIDAPDESPDIVIEDVEGQEQTFTYSAVTEVLMPRIEETVEWVNEDIGKAGLDSSMRSVYYLAGNAIASIRGGREFVSKQLDHSIKVPSPRPGRWSDSVYISALGLMDMAFEVITIEQSSKKGGPFAAVAAFLKNFITR